MLLVNDENPYRRGSGTQVDSLRPSGTLLENAVEAMAILRRSFYPGGWSFSRTLSNLPDLSLKVRRFPSIDRQVGMYPYYHRKRSAPLKTYVYFVTVLKKVWVKCVCPNVCANVCALCVLRPFIGHGHTHFSHGHTHFSIFHRSVAQHLTINIQYRGFRENHKQAPYWFDKNVGGSHQTSFLC